MESVICCCKYYRTNVLINAVRINLIFLFNWFLVTVSSIHICLAPLSTIILIMSAWTVPGSIVILFPCKLSSLRQNYQYIVGLLWSRLCGIKHNLPSNRTLSKFAVNQKVWVRVTKNCPTFQVYFISEATEVNTSLTKAKNSNYIEGQQNRPIWP